MQDKQSCCITLQCHEVKTLPIGQPQWKRELCDTQCEAVEQVVDEDLGKRAWDPDVLVMYGMNQFERINETGKSASEFSLW